MKIYKNILDFEIINDHLIYKDVISNEYVKKSILNTEMSIICPYIAEDQLIATIENSHI